MSEQAAEAPKKTTLTVTIDGRAGEAKPGELLIAFAERTGTYIPRFCWHPRMREVGMCRMCLVDVEGPRGPALLPACMLPVAEGMVVNTQSPTVKKAQDGVLEFLLINHPLDCPVCDKGGECPLQDSTMTFGPGETRFVEEKRHFEKPIAISDLVYLDRERCILCDRCTRFSKDVAGDPLIHFVNRGNYTEVNTFPDDPYASYFSGNVVQICPVGALTAKPYRFSARPWDLDQVESTCTSCAVGCRIVVQSSGDRVTRFQGVDSDPVNWGWLCDKGRFGYEAIHAPDRLTTPTIRTEMGAAPQPASWHDALTRAAAILTEAGPAKVGFIGGAQFTNEDAFAWSWLAKGVLGTDNVDAQIGDGLPADLWLGLPEATIDDLAKASAVLLLGPDLKEELPVLFLRARDAAVNRQVPFFELAPITSGMTRYAKAALHYRPGEVAVALRGLLNAASGKKVAEHSVAGLDADTVNAAGEALAAALTSGKGNGKLVVVLGRANLADTTASVREAVALLSTGIKDVSFLMAMRRANIRGALDMGLAPGLLPGRVSLAAGTDWFRQHGWTRLPRDPGLDTAGILRAAADGKITTLVLLGADPLVDFPDRALVDAAFGNVFQVIAVDTMPNASNALATVLFPATSHGEKAGTVANLEGRVTTLAAKASGPGVARPDWMIAAELAAHLDADLGVESVWGITEEIARVAPAYHGVTVDALRTRGHRDGILAPLPVTAPPQDEAAADPSAADATPSEPATADDAPAEGSGALAEGDSPASSPPPAPALAAPLPMRTQFESPVGVVPVPQPDAYSLRLVVARVLYDGGVRVAASPSLAKLGVSAGLRLHPGEIERHGLHAGGPVRVTAPNGLSLVLPVVSDERVARGTAFLPMAQSADAGALRLVDSATADGATKVRLESIPADAAPAPAPAKEARP